jgi:hypothetical protein
LTQARRDDETRRGPGDERAGIVVRTAVDDDVLDLRVRLRCDACQRPLDEPIGVERGRDDGD